MARFHPHERQYLRGMKRKDRTDIIRTIERDTKSIGALHSTPLRIQVLQSNIPVSIKMQMFETLRTCGNEKYVQWVTKCLQLPLKKLSQGYTATKPSVAIAQARAHMDAVASGFEDVKTEILKIVCQQASGAPCAAGFSIGLEGPPGTGKTHFSRNAIAGALKRPMVEIQLGGATDISYLLGIMYTYEGSKEGRLAAGLIESGVSNPVIYFDELMSPGENR